MNSPIKHLTVTDLMKRIDEKETTLIVGVFDAMSAFESHKITGAVPLAELKGMIPNLDRNTTLVFYSTTNNHDHVLRVSKQVTDYGFYKVFVLEGGWSAWKKQKSTATMPTKKSFTGKKELNFKRRPTVAKK